MRNDKSIDAKLGQYYANTAFIVLNTVIALIVLNIALWIAFFIKDSLIPPPPKWSVIAAKAFTRGGELVLFDSAGAPLDNGKRSEYQLQWFDYTAYQSFTDAAHAATVLDDFFDLSTLGFAYQPWVQFSEAPYKGKLVNVDVDAMGLPIRRTANPKTADRGANLIRVFVFGGSTTFGYNVADEHTWPTYLSTILNERASAQNYPVTIEVTNYGRGFYETSQETVLLMDVLKGGVRPDLVLFMDGVNWGPKEDVPEFTDKFEKGFHRLQFGINAFAAAMDSWRWIPAIRLGYSLKERLSRAGADKSANKSDQSGGDERHVAHVINRFTQNRALAVRICEQYSTRALFFLQPDAVYNYPASLYRLSLPDTFLVERPDREQFYAHMKQAEGYIDLTGLFESWGPQRKAIVDDVHYSPGFNRFLAQKVADHIDLRQLVAKAATSDQLRSTGRAREPALSGQVLPKH
jgi:hypothetical protein